MYMRGSPPPMRGKVSFAKSSIDFKGITPAYAGKSIWCGYFMQRVRDHPRLCGEKFTPSSSIFAAAGSPPPMRGKERLTGILQCLFRITPAYAGKSYFKRRCETLCRDHPRLCGEKTKKITKQRYFFHQPASFSFSLQYT